MSRLNAAAATGLAMWLLGAGVCIAGAPALAAPPGTLATPSASGLDAAPSAGLAASGASSAALSSYALTAAVAALDTDGTIGASGGLVTLDSGQASVIARLVSTPSSSVRAQPVRPGSAFEEVASQVPGQPLSVPEADAAYPGEGAGSVDLVQGVSAGPLSAGGGHAVARAAADHLSGAAADTSGSVSGLYSNGSTTATVTAVADGEAGKLEEAAHTTVSELDVGGVLVLKDVDAVAKITVGGGKRTQKAQVTIGSATVAGQAVTISSDGISAAGVTVPGSTAQAVTKQLNSVLGQAGITVTAISATTSSHDGSQYANTGGIGIEIRTPALPGGIAGNVASLRVGAISLTETDEALLPTTGTGTFPSTGGNQISAAPQIGIATTPSNSVVAPSGQQPPSVAGPPAVSAPSRLVLAGRSLSHMQLVLGLAAWQFLSLMTPTLYALANRRRGLRPLGPQ